MTRATTYRFVLLLGAFLMLPLCSLMAQQSDLELLRRKEFAPVRDDRSVEYGIEPSRQTLSPIYHAASGSLWLWENLVAPDVCSPGGYTDTNTAYFKGLMVEYGAVRALFYGLDRMVRNTKIGRHTTPKNQRGLIEDSIDRYRQ